MPTAEPKPGSKRTFKPSNIANGVDPFLAMAVLDRANALQAQGRGVHHLEVGQPGTGAPPSARKAVEEAMGRAVMGYTSAMGMPTLRQGIAGYYAARYGREVDPACIAITNGSSAGFVLAFLASFDPGARVALTAPGYPAYRNIIKALGFEPVLLEVTAQTGFQPTPEILTANAPLDGLILASPSNPTGTMVTPRAFDALHQWCEDNGCRMISDEIYHGLTWGQPESTLAGRDTHGILVNSFSKYFSMTGWRVGWLVLPPDLVAPVERLAQNLFICAPAISQIAAEGALQDLDFLDQLCVAYQQKADVLYQALAKVGLGADGGTNARSDGAFYAYIDVSSLTDSSTLLAARVLEDTGVAIVPGVDFDPINGERFVRLSFAGPMEHVVQGAEKLAAWVSANR